MKKIKTAVIPMAGLGTAWRPISSTIPKEMLPIGTFPIIHHLVKECFEAGIENIYFVISPKKEIIKDYLIQQFKGFRMHFVYQDYPNGLADAIFRIKNCIQDEYFLMLLGDEIVFHTEQSEISRMMNIFQESQESLIAYTPVPPDQVHKYGIIDLDETNRIINCVEKPSHLETQSNLAMVGRYIIHRSIFSIIEKISQSNIDKEEIFTRSLEMLCNSEKVWGYQIQGKRFDCGNLEGFVLANNYYLENYVFRNQKPSE